MALACFNGIAQYGAFADLTKVAMNNDSYGAMTQAIHMNSQAPCGTYNAEIGYSRGVPYSSDVSDYSIYSHWYTGGAENIAINEYPGQNNAGIALEIQYMGSGNYQSEYWDGGSWHTGTNMNGIGVGMCESEIGGILHGWGFVPQGQTNLSSATEAFTNAQYENASGSWLAGQWGPSNVMYQACASWSPCWNGQWVSGQQWNNNYG